MGKLSFGTTGIAYECDKVTMDSNGAPRCPRCRDRVYYNEEKKAVGKSWHKRCFICVTCRRSLDSTNCNEHDGEVYCGSCHRRQFGPRGYGYAGGAAGLSTESSVEQLRPQPGSQVYAVPENIPATSIDPESLDCCPSCGKRVYFAEEVKALKRSWHKLCFKCNNCRKLLEPGSCSEHEGNIFCRACYSKQFGPKGYGFAGGAGSMLAAEDRYSVEARAANGAQSNDGETYTLRMKSRRDSAEDRYTSDNRSVNLSQSNDNQTYTLETRRRPSAGSMMATCDRYTTDTARGVKGKVERPSAEIHAIQPRPLPADSRYTSQSGTERLADEQMYTIKQQAKPSACSRLFPDDRLNPETRLKNGSPERSTAESYNMKGRIQPRTDSGVPTDDRYPNNAKYTNGTNRVAAEHRISGASTGHIPDDRYNTTTRYTNGERRASNESYSILARAQPSAGLSNDVHYTTDYRRVNGTTDQPTGESYNTHGRPQPTAALVPSAAQPSETRLMNDVSEQPTGETYSIQTRARPNVESGLPGRYTALSRPKNGTTDTYTVHSGSSSALSTDCRSPNAWYTNGSSGTGETYHAQPRAQSSSSSSGAGETYHAQSRAQSSSSSSGVGETYHAQSRAQSSSSSSGAVPEDRYMNGARLMNGATGRPSGDKYASHATAMSSTCPLQFTDRRYSIDAPVSSPNGRYNGQTRVAAPLTTAAVEERQYSIQARATPSAAYRSPVQNGPGKAAPVYV